MNSPLDERETLGAKRLEDGIDSDNCIRVGALQPNLVERLVNKMQEKRAS